MSTAHAVQPKPALPPIRKVTGLPLDGGQPPRVELNRHGFGCRTAPRTGRLKLFFCGCERRTRWWTAMELSIGRRQCSQRSVWR
jgi:hypothetical protein